MRDTDIRELARRLAAQAETVARLLLPNGHRQGSEWCVGSIAGERGKTLKVHLSGPKAGIWADFANPNDKGDLVELWTRVKNISKAEALAEIRRYLGMSNPKTGILLLNEAGSKPKFINEEYHRSLRANLARSEVAMGYLMGPKRGLDRHTIEYFGLGLSSPYEGKSGLTKDALVAPMRSPSTGAFLGRLAYICIPGLTLNPVSTNGWMKGAPQTYYAQAKRGHSVLFICEGLKDVWRHWKELSASGMSDDVLLVSSTHGSAFPNEWRTNQFWEHWTQVYLGQDNDEPGNRIAERVLEFAGRQAHRIKVPDKLGKDWTDFWQNGGDIELFRALLDDAPVASAASIVSAPTQNQGLKELGIGRFSYNPVDINGAYVNGYLYYPTKTHVIREDENTGAPVERLETIVIRSDRTLHRAVYATSPPGTPLSDRVLKLTDGTVIEKEPKVSLHHTWSWESIQKYLNGTGKPRRMALIFHDIVRALKQAVWLPDDEDYITLALAVPVTYLQYVFNSVPLFLLNGPAGSGKTQLGNTMAELCANSAVVGQISAATAARLIDETRGFIVLDDVESIAAKSGKDAQINDLIQHLKVSYNRKTAKKPWTDIKTMKPETLDFYGVKMLSNTLGADPVLNTRMIRIQTRKMPEWVKATIREFTAEELEDLHLLRNELHTWAFENVSRVEKAYHAVYASKTDRHAEIAAPLRSIAMLVEDPDVSAKLESSLARQSSQQRTIDDDPVETLKEAVRNVIKQGFTVVTITHVQLEMRTLIDANFGITHTTEIPEWDRPEWIGRQLRSHDLVMADDLGRRRFFGKNLRLVRFKPWAVQEVLKDVEGNSTPVTAQAPEAFCRGCDMCPYRNAGCDLQAARAQEESKTMRVLRQ